MAPQKILAGIGIVTLVGCAALGFLIFKKSGELDTQRTAFTTEANTYKTLRTLELYPNEENLKKLEGERDAAAAAAEGVLNGLTSKVIALETITPEQFQDKLRAIISSISEKAVEQKIALPENFYLGFDEYRAKTPRPDAVASLWRQLRALETVVVTLLDSRIDAITGFERTALPEEGGKPMPTALVNHFPFTVAFRADQSAFRKALNGIVSNQQQFFITRSLIVENENDNPIPKEADPAAASVAAAPLPAAAAAGDTAAEGSKAGALQYIVGTEKLNVTLNLEMVTFANSFKK